VGVHFDVLAARGEVRVSVVTHGGGDSGLIAQVARDQLSLWCGGGWVSCGSALVSDGEDEVVAGPERGSAAQRL
jgi:hypothetical protein